MSEIAKPIIKATAYRSLIDSMTPAEKRTLDQFSELITLVSNDVRDVVEEDLREAKSDKSLTAGQALIVSNHLFRCVRTEAYAHLKRHELTIQRLERRIAELEEAATKP